MRWGYYPHQGRASQVEKETRAERQGRTQTLQVKLLQPDQYYFRIQRTFKLSDTNELPILYFCSHLL